MGRTLRRDLLWPCAVGTVLIGAFSCTFGPISSDDNGGNVPENGGRGGGGAASVAGAGRGGVGADTAAGAGRGGVGGTPVSPGGASGASHAAGAAGGPQAGAAGSLFETGGTSGGGGAPKTAGAAGSPQGGAAGSPTSPFILRFRDEFDELSPSRWRPMTHSWEGNLALFSAQAVSTSGGMLTLTLRSAPEGTTDDTGSPKSFLGAEVRSVDTLTYGRVRARAKFARGSAVVSALVGIYTPWPADNWNELDIEHLGYLPASVQFNTMVYTGGLPATQVPVTPTAEPFAHALGFDATDDFHVYAFEWTPEGASFSVDERTVYRWAKRIHLMTLPQNVLLTIWASSSEAWAGPVTSQTTGASAQYDWVELYDYSPAVP